MALQHEGIEDPWTCVCCFEEHALADQWPSVIPMEHEGRFEDFMYCNEGMGIPFQGIANGEEHAGPPQIGHTLLAEIPGVLDRIDQDVRRRYEENLARMNEAAPQNRICCSHRTDGRYCNARIGTRTLPSDDRLHQWTSCPACGLNVCLACGVAQNNDNAQLNDCARPAELVDLEEKRGSRDRGLKFQFCPGCDRFFELYAGCNAINCVCGTTMCFICGNAAERDHWQSAQGGCPRYYAPDDSRSSGDDPWEDAQNIGGFDFPQLRPGNSEWRQHALRVSELDRKVRQWRRVHIDAEERVVSSVKSLLLHARHLFIMIANRMQAPDFGLVYGEPYPNQVFERLRFAHHATKYRGLMLTLIMDGCEHILERLDHTIPWREAFFPSRRLDLRKDYAIVDRMMDLRTLETLLKDRLFHLDGQLTESAAGAAETERLESKRIARRVVSECLALTAILLHPYGRYSELSTSVSYYVTAHLKTLHERMNEITALGEDAYRGVGPDECFAADCAHFFLYRCFQERSHPLAEQQKEWEAQLLGDSDHHEWAKTQIWVDDQSMVLSELLREGDELSQEQSSQMELLREGISTLKHVLLVYPPYSGWDTDPIRQSSLEQVEQGFENYVYPNSTYPTPHLQAYEKMRPIAFGILQAHLALLDFFGTSPMEPFPDREEEETEYHWRRAQELHRHVHGVERTAARDGLTNCITLLRRIFFIVIRGNDFPDIEPTPFEHALTLREAFHQRWDGLNLPVVLPGDGWTAIREELNRLPAIMEHAIRSMPHYALARLGIHEPQEPDEEVGGRPLRQWFEHAIFVQEFLHRLEQAGEGGGREARGLQRLRTGLGCVMWSDEERANQIGPYAPIRLLNRLSDLLVDLEEDIPWHILLPAINNQNRLTAIVRQVLEALKDLRELEGDPAPGPDSSDDDSSDGSDGDGGGGARGGRRNGGVGRPGQQPGYDRLRDPRVRQRGPSASWSQDDDPHSPPPEGTRPVVRLPPPNQHHNHYGPFDGPPRGDPYVPRQGGGGEDFVQNPLWNGDAGSATGNADSPPSGESDNGFPGHLQYNGPDSPDGEPRSPPPEEGGSGSPRLSNDEVQGMIRDLRRRTRRDEDGSAQDGPIDPDPQDRRLWHRFTNNWHHDSAFVEELATAYDNKYAEGRDAEQEAVAIFLRELSTLLSVIRTGSWNVHLEPRREWYVKLMRDFRDEWHEEWWEPLREFMREFIVVEEGVDAMTELGRLRQVAWHVLAVLHVV